MNIFFSVITLVMGIVIYWFFYNKTKDSMNPWGVTVIAYCFAAALGMSHMSPLQDTWHTITYIIIWLFPVVIAVIGASFKIKQSRKVVHERFIFSGGYVLVSRIIITISILCAIAEWGQNGFIITLLETNAYDNKELWAAFSILNYGTQLLPYVAIACFFELIFRKNLRTKDKYLCIAVIAFNVFYTLFCLVSRGGLLIFILGALYILTRIRKFNIKRLSIIICIILVASYVFMQIRLGNTESLVFNVIPGQPFISSIYGYTGLNFENLNKLVVEGPDYSIIGRSLGGILQLFGGESIMNLTPKHQTVFFNAAPMIYDFYDDLGIVGVIFYTMLYFAIVGYVYKKSICNPRYILLTATFQKAVIFAFYGNYFAAYRVILFPFLVVACMVYSFRFVYKK